MKFSKRVFLIAGIYGLAVMVPQYFMAAKIGQDFPPAITHVEYFYGFIGLAVVFQFLFLLIANDPVRFRPMMIVAIFEKVVFAVPALLLFAQGRLAIPTLTGGVIDLVLGTLFIIAFRSTAETGTHP